MDCGTSSESVVLHGPAVSILHTTPDLQKFKVDSNGSAASITKFCGPSNLMGAGGPEDAGGGIVFDVVLNGPHFLASLTCLTNWRPQLSSARFRKLMVVAGNGRRNL